MRPTPAQRNPQYRVLPADEHAAAALARACSLGVTAGQLLLNRGVTDPSTAEAYLEATLRGLSSPASMADRGMAADRLVRAIQAGERIVVFGDYDVDGTTSALILTEIVEALGGQARTVIADRFRGGYGLSNTALEDCMATSPSVLVTCDCGSSDHERIAEASRRGADVIVVDHHLVPDEPLPALAFLNPHRPECAFGFKGLCSAGLAFSLGAALRAEMSAKIDLREWLDLVAIGTIADLAPLDGDNRRLVRAGLKRFGSGSTRPALRALRQVTNLPDSPYLTARDVAFRVAPRLNAPGRLGHADLTLRLLASKTLTDALRLVQEVEQTNDERKALTHRASDEARAQVVEIYGAEPARGVVVASEAWHRGVVGIVAARLVDAFSVPVVAIAFDGEVGHGSARTPKGFDVYRALEHAQDSLDGWGGHRAAAGLSLRRAELDAFRAAFADATGETSREATPQQAVDVELGGAFRIPTVEDLARLGPFGEGNPTPRYLARAHIAELKGVGEDQAHAKLRLQIGSDTVRAFAPSQFAKLEGRQDATLIGEVQPDHFIGGQAVEFLVTDVLDS
ncbi:MAG: single-stranded-DNA-specific exonuclease RecJ [Myxococcota bacterium]